MSNATLGMGGGGSGSAIQTITGDDGIAVPPTAFNINLLTGSTTANDTDGIRDVGNAGTSTETVQLTNRQYGTVTTSDATPTTILTFAAAAVATCYDIQVRITAFDATDVAGGAYFIIGGARTTGAATTIFPDTEFFVKEEAAMATSDIDLTASGNNIVVTVTGIAAKTIRWAALLTYIQVI